MKLGFFTRPLHPLDKNWQTCLNEDREAIILADKLGYSEAYVGEHLSDRAENRPFTVSRSTASFLRVNFEFAKRSASALLRIIEILTTQASPKKDQKAF